MDRCDSRGESFPRPGGQAHDLTARLSDDHLGFLLLPIVQVALKCHGVPGRIPYKRLNVRRPGIERRSVHEDGSRQVGMKRRSKEALMGIDHKLPDEYNDIGKMAGYAMTSVMFNHVISMIDAVITTNIYNIDRQQSRISAQPILDLESKFGVGGIKFNYRF